MSILTVNIAVLVYSHKHGIDVSLHPDQDAALDAACEIAAEWWHDEEIPFAWGEGAPFETQSDALREYCEREEEEFDIELRPFDLGPVPDAAAARLIGTIARMTKAGEPVGDNIPFEWDDDDARETLEGLIDIAREIDKKGDLLAIKARNALVAAHEHLKEILSRDFSEGDLYDLEDRLSEALTYTPDTPAPRFVPVLEYPEAIESPEVLGVFDTYDEAMAACDKRGDDILAEYADDGFVKEARSSGFDLDNDESLFCFRITEIV